MVYSYLTYPDDTEVTYGDMLADGTVKVYIERPNDDGGFDSAVCYLPNTELREVRGFSLFDTLFLTKMLRDNAKTIMEYSREGSSADAAAI